MLAAVSLGACAPPNEFASRSEGVVYDEDGRQDLYEVADPFIAGVARDAVVAFVHDRPGYLVPRGDGSFDPDPYTLAEAVEAMGAEDPNDALPTLPFCADERFAAQPTIANCTGTLIAEDLVLTAGHCTNMGACPDATVLAFDYFYAAPGVIDPIEGADLYRCAEVVTYAYDPTDGTDFAILRLDRPALERRPVPVDSKFAVAVGEPLSVLGFPAGLPLKVEQSGHVTSISPDGVFFEANTDTFAGSSGSGVFNEAGVLLGVLVRGNADYVTKGDCLGVNVLSSEPDTNFEDVSYAATAVLALCRGEHGVDVPLCDSVREPKGRGCAAAPGAGGGALWLLGLVFAGLARRRN